MSIQRVLQEELIIKDYAAKLAINPSNVYYQSVSARNVSVGGSQWTITSPSKRSHLLSWAVVNWRPTVTRIRADGTTAQAWGTSYNRASFKPCMPFANAMSSITISVNGSTLTLSQPRRFMEQLTWANVTRDEAEACYESGYPHNLGGQVNITNPGAKGLDVIQDEGMYKNETSFNTKVFNTTTPPAVRYNAIPGAVALTYQEPLIVPPFNPFAKVKKDMPDYMWFKSMSDMIPNIDRLEIDIQFQNISAGVLFPFFIQAPANFEDKFLNITALEADLKLYWYEMPVNMSIPQSIDVNTWNVREFQKSIASTASGAAIDDTGLISDLIQLNSVPSLIMVSIKRNQDQAATYLSRAMTVSDDFTPTNLDVGNGPVHSWDSYAEIKGLEIVLGNRPNVISSTFSQRELYYLTQKNSKVPYPYDFTSWTSKREIPVTAAELPNVAAAEWTDYSPKCMVLLRPKDISEQLSDGVFAPNSLQIKVTSAIARDGVCGIPGGAQEYKMYIHLFFGKHFLRIEKDKAQFQEQSLPLSEALRLTNPVLQQQGVSGLGGRLAGLRESSARGFGGGVISRV